MTEIVSEFMRHCGIYLNQAHSVFYSYFVKMNKIWNYKLLENKISIFISELELLDIK